MSKQLIFIIAALISLTAAGNYLDNYFCTNEICNQYWIDCSSAETTDDKNYCNARSAFLKCVKSINLKQSSDEKNKQYNACRALVTYDNANQYFYFLNCQINCGYQNLWIACGEELNQIQDCPGANCISSQDYSDWNQSYVKCTAVEDTNNCTFVSSDLISDCQNSVKAKCKTKASSYVGKSNKYVNLMQCESISLNLIFSIFTLLIFLVL